tara:strand:+ start:702 stop:1223 length:522 start_codon:yes stop_codon:yes gene_type:complete
MKTTILAFAMIIGLASTVHAGSTITYGKITKVEPVYTKVTSRQPVQYCKQVQVPIYGSKGQNNGNALLGAIIGGVIGNQFGSGSGKEAATALGAVIGAQKGSQSGNKNIVGYETVNQCHTEYENNVTHSVINEYDLTYNVNGNIIKVRVNRAVGSNAYIGKRQKFRINYQIIN